MVNLVPDTSVNGTLSLYTCRLVRRQNFRVSWANTPAGTQRRRSPQLTIKPCWIR